MIRLQLPPHDEMLTAFMGRDGTYDGVFYTAVRTTGIFCRPTCPARKPRPENVEFFASARDAMLSGYRACKRCRPLEPSGEAPEWLRSLVEEVEADPARRWTDQDLRDRGLNPDRVRRWFQQQYGMTFHGYGRARRLGLALGRLRLGEDVATVAMDHGYDSLSGFGEAFGSVFGSAPSRARGRTVVTVTRIPTPLGPMVAGATDDRLVLLEFADRRMLETQIQRLERRLDARFVPGDRPVLVQTATELDEYFEGVRQRFEMPWMAPGSAFQEEVWAALVEIPCGATVTYGELAERLGRGSGGARAVGRAVGDNRLGIVVPCHRVVGADGRLTGYGGHPWRKQALLEHEQAALAAAS